jgi:hypothetical protein
MIRQDQRRVQEQYERLRADQPHLPHKELWHLAEQAVMSDAQLVRAADPELSRLAVIGFVLMCIATGLATVLFIWNWNSLLDWAYSDVGDWLWLSAFLLGPIALGVILIANHRIKRSWGGLSGKRLVEAGFALAVVGTLEVAFVSFPIALSGSL